MTIIRQVQKIVVLTKCPAGVLGPWRVVIPDLPKPIEGHSDDIVRISGQYANRLPPKNDLVVF